MNPKRNLSVALLLFRQLKSTVFNIYKMQKIKKTDRYKHCDDSSIKKPSDVFAVPQRNIF